MIELPYTSLINVDLSQYQIYFVLRFVISGKGRLK